MKKMEKETYVVTMMSEAIRDAKNKFFDEYKEEFNNKVTFSIYDSEDDDTLITLMLSSYDCNHKHLVSNWIYNAYDCTSNYMKSKKIEFLCDDLGLDIPHFMWGQENLINKIRYIQILERDEIEHLNAPVPYIVAKERGYEYDLFRKKVYPIKKAWVYWKKGGEN